LLIDITMVDQINVPHKSSILQRENLNLQVERRVMHVGAIITDGSRKDCADCSEKWKRRFQELEEKSAAISSLSWSVKWQSERDLANAASTRFSSCQNLGRGSCSLHMSQLRS